VILNKQSKPKKLKSIEIKESWCKGCAICVDACPKGVLEMDHLIAKVVHLENCIICGRCEVSCPDFCIEVILDENPN
jgi:2-oxoglutarate ferredoxin oxidoreductase subunit delta